MSATAQEQKTIRPIRPCFTIHKEYIHYDEIDCEEYKFDMADDDDY